MNELAIVGQITDQRMLAHEVELLLLVGVTLEQSPQGAQVIAARGGGQDKDETERSIAAGLPVVSVSLGDTARFLFGGSRRRDPVEPHLLESGDAFVFGGPARLRYHGVSRIVPGTAPPSLGISGRFNLTFRRF